MAASSKWQKIAVHRAIMGVISLVLLFVPFSPDASAFDYAKDTAAVGAAFMTSLALHEVGHQVVAEEAGADSPRMSFFKNKNGSFFFGLSECKDLPKKSKLSHHVGGEWMADRTFEFSRQSYHREPTTYNKALMFFSGTGFLWYTIYSFYIGPDNDSYDPNGIREELGWSKETLLSVVAARTLMNVYRMYDRDAKFMPIIMLDSTTVALLLRFDF